MRKFALAFSLFVPVFSSAQTPVTSPTAENIVNQTFANLNGHSDVSFVLTGTEKVGTVSAPFDTTITWRRIGIGSDRTLKVSVVKRINDQVVQEIRANGKTLYAYDFKTRTYSATPYHQIGNPQTPDQRDAAYSVRLLTLLSRSASSSGPDSYAARLVTEAMGDPIGFTQMMGENVPQYYRSWMPGRTPYELPCTLPPTTYNDPVVPQRTRTGDVEYGYTPNEQNRYFMYDASPRRSLVFHVYQPEPTSPPQDLQLTRVFFGEASQSGGRNRLTQWTLSLSYPVVAPADVATYEARFSPYTDMRGWRIVTSATGQKG